MKEGGRGEQERRKAREERKASRAAAARWGPEPRPRDSEPDLIESGDASWSGWAQRRGSERRGAQVRQGRRPYSRRGPLTARQAPRPVPAPAFPGPGPARGPQRFRVASPSPSLPLLPPRPGRHSLREGGAARACASLTSTCCVTASDSADADASGRRLESGRATPPPALL